MEQKSKKDIGTTTFPWLYSALNGLFIFLVWWVGWKVDAVLYGNYADPFLMLIFTFIVMCVLWFASSAFQFLVYGIFKRCIQRRLAWFLIFMLPAMAFSIAYGKLIHHQCQPHIKASSILSLRPLAELPTSASEIKVWRTQFHDFLRFHASPGDIEVFLKASSYLNDNKHVECEVYSSTRKRLERPQHHAPDWYDRTLKESGRVYSEYGFELIVNDNTNTVFLHLER